MFSTPVYLGLDLRVMMSRCMHAGPGYLDDLHLKVSVVSFPVPPLCCLEASFAIGTGHETNVSAFFLLLVLPKPP